MRFFARGRRSTVGRPGPRQARRRPLAAPPGEVAARDGAIDRAGRGRRSLPPAPRRRSSEPDVLGGLAVGQAPRRRSARQPRRPASSCGCARRACRGACASSGRAVGSRLGRAVARRPPRTSGSSSSSASAAISSRARRRRRRARPRPPAPRPRRPACASVARRARVGFSASDSAVSGSRWRSTGESSSAQATPSVTAVIRTFTFLPTSFAALGDDDVEARRPCRHRRAGRRGRPRRASARAPAPTSTGSSGASFSSVPWSSTRKWSRCTSSLADEEEAALRRLLELAEPRRRRADDERGDLRVQLDLERLRRASRA